MIASILPDVDRRPTRRDAQRQLEHATSIAIASFSRCFRELCPRIEDDLFTLAQEETDRTRQMHMLDAYGLVRANRERIEALFKEAIESIVHERAGGGAARAAADSAKSAIDFSALSLVGDGELEAEVIVKRMVSRMRSGDSTGQSDIDDLDERLGFLLGEEKPLEANNPFSPDALCRAIQQACSDLDAPIVVQHEILRTIEPKLAPSFASAYRDLNGYMVESNVLPDVAAYRKRRYAQRASSTQPSLQTTPHAARVDTHTVPAAVARTVGQASSASAQSRRSDVLSRYTEHIERRHPQHRGSHEDAPTGGRGTSTRSASIGGAAIQGLVALLPTHNVFVDPATFVSAPLRDINMLHAVGRAARARGVPRDEEILIDLVALVVDQILLDTRVPDRIKRLIARLQVPLLRCALLDRSLFSRPAHPARVLVDTIARSSIGWEHHEADDGADARFDDLYYQLVFDVVAQIEATFDTDLAVFDEQTSRINEALAEHAHTEAKRFAGASELIAQAELRDLADQQALLQIRDALVDVELPEDIVDFLLDPWRRVLVEASVVGAAAEQVAELRQVIHDLVWSVQPKIDVDERQRLIELLPALIKRMREGMTAIAEPLEAQQRYFNALMAAHANAVRVGARTASEDHAFARFETRIDAMRIDPERAPADWAAHVPAEIVAQAAQLGDVSIEVAAEPVIKLGAQVAHDRSEVEAIIASLARGTWAEIFDRETQKIAKLRWISPRKSTYLFTNREGTEAISYTPELLRLHVEIGHLHVLDSTDLTARALEGIEASIETA